MAQNKAKNSLFSFQKSSADTVLEEEEEDNSNISPHKLFPEKKSLFAHKLFQPQLSSGKSDSCSSSTSGKSDEESGSSDNECFSCGSSSRKPKKGLFEKLLTDLHISPNLSPSKKDLASIESVNLSPLLNLAPTAVPKKKDYNNLFKDILISKPKKGAIRDEPCEKLCEKYGQCLSKIIGVGATSSVKLVLCPKNGNKLYAVKEFRKKGKNENQKQYMKRMTSEFCISSSLHHPHIVETIDLVVGDKHSWCEVMEYCGGGSLFDILQDRKLLPSEINCCFKQLLYGVNYIHAMGVAHRDLKPENILFDDEGQLKISDFGASDVFKNAFEDKPHLSRGLCGSMPYIAPEEFDGSDYDAREVDIWATGVIYYAMTYCGLPWYVHILLYLTM